jgi:hypothetical protein
MNLKGLKFPTEWQFKESFSQPEQGGSPSRTLLAKSPINWVWFVA